MNLVIVESPSKCRKIEGFLGSDFRVVASMGHFRDLPAKGFGMDLETMEPTYTITKPEVSERLAPLIERAEKVYLCTDPDREGEAIAWHLTHLLPDDKPRLRATFQEITQKAVRQAIDNPGELRMPMVDAQQARRMLDRLVGYKLSPELWRAFKGRGALSAGRVQSVATRLIVDREREIQAFDEKVSFKIVAKLEKDQTEFLAELKKIVDDSGPTKGRFQDKEKATSWLAEIKDSPFTVEGVKTKEQKVKPQPPFTTSNLQAKAAHVLKMSASRSMQVAQKLYEGGHITYHRTDSVAISDDAIKNSRQLIQQNYGEKYLPKKATRYKNQASAQEAHECIRPTKIDRQTLQGVPNDEARLYELIWKQFISSQMNPGLDALTIVDISSGPGRFEARGRMELFDGFRILNRTEVEEKSRKKKEEESEEKQKLPALSKGDEPKLKGLDVKEVKTRPPARFNEASLIKRLEKEGIGRPSTYASIVTTIVKRRYVRLEKRRYYAEDLGCDITDFLVQRFPRVLELGFTRTCESRLDSIGEGELHYQEFLLKFWAYLKEQIQKASRIPLRKPQSTAKSSPKTASSKKNSTTTNSKGMPCPKCSRTTVVEESKKWSGRYFHCCHNCRMYLETNAKGSQKKGDWISPTG